MKLKTNGLGGGHAPVMLPIDPPLTCAIRAIYASSFAISTAHQEEGGSQKVE